MLVALTGCGLLEDNRRARAAGFDQHLLRPFDRDQVMAMIALRVNDESGPTRWLR